ncbi:MAG: polysaccharide deacetylase family protein [Planctomycetia bacterium]|nr:polysaccharide deacetylase family protein [Planctomycetia bacterium]
MKTTVVLGFDMETDVGSWTPFYNGLVHGTPVMLDILAKHGLTGTFFFTGDAARSHPEVVKSVAAAGHEVGCHSMYHQTLGDSIMPIPGIYPLLPHEVRPRIELATKIVEDIIGKKVVSFRCPRLFGSTDVTNALEDLGYVADATYPMFFYGDRLLPYHPSKDDWTKEGDLKLVEIPCFADMSIEAKDEYGRDRDQWPIYRIESAEALMKHVRNFIEFVSKKHTEACVCFYFHPWEFHPMPQGEIHYGEGSVRPHTSTVKNGAPYPAGQFDKVLASLQESGAEFLQAGQVTVD